VVSVLARSRAAVDPRLIRAYRRLIRVYPRGPRRDELLDTLVECATPGRRRPALREVVNLAYHGSRARLGRPGSRGIVVLALFVALAAGFLGASGANRLGWQAVGSLPVGADAAEIRQTVFPGLTVWGGGDAAKIVSQSDGEGIEYGYAISWVKHTPATRDVAGYTAAARGRLETAGWTVTSVDPPLDQTDVVGADPGDRAEGFTAERGALALRFSDYYWPGRPPYDSDGNATYTIWHQAPWWLTGVTWFGALLAAFLAWLLTGWVSRRLEPEPAASVPVLVGAVFCVLGVVPAALLAVPAQSADETAAPFWQGFAYFGTMPAMLAGLAAALIVGVAVAQKPPHRLQQWRRHAASWPGTLRRRPSVLITLIAATTILIGLGLYRLDTGQLAAGSCTPSTPSGIEDPPSARLSYLARVFISPQATADQRNLAQAAIGRGFGGGYTFNGGPRSSGFTDAFCGRGRVSAEIADALPWYWTVDLASPGLFDGLAAEVIVMPGVVAVQHVPTP
jgi:hypothetical protein